MTIYTRDRHPVPELAAWLTGKQQADQLAEHGLTLPDDRLIELGRAVIEHADPIDPADPRLVELLAQLAERNAAMRRELETAPELHPDHARDPETGDERGLGEEQTGERGREQRRYPGRDKNLIKEQLDYEPPDEDWS